MKTVAKRVLLGILCVALAAGISAVFFTKDKSADVSAAVVADNGETIIRYEDKTNILQNIMAKEGKLVILEIVPYKYAGIMDILCGTDKVTNVLETNKKTFYNLLKADYTVSTLSHVTTVKAAMSGTREHPFYITYNALTNEYNVEYPNFFLEEFLDGITDPELFEYINSHTEVRSVTAAELTEEDLEGVSLVYISSGAESADTALFNSYIDGKSNIAQFKSGTSTSVGLGVYSDASGSTEYKGSDRNNVGYNGYIRNSAGAMVQCDMSWNMVDALVRKIYEGNEYTGTTNSIVNPIPVIIDYKQSVLKKDSNIYKLMAILMKTSNEPDAVYSGASMYYETVLDGMATGTDYVNSYGVQTAAYISNGVEYKTWDDNNVPFFKVESLSNYSCDYLSNFVYRTSCVDYNNYGMYNTGRGYGSVNATQEKDTSKTVVNRGVIPESDSRYYLDAPLRYLFGSEENNTDTVKVLELQPQNDFSYMVAGMTGSKKTENINNIMAFARALKIRCYTRTDGSETQYNYVNKIIEFSNMTIDQFNGMREDLLSTYDIIYIGENYDEAVVTVTDGTSLYKDSTGLKTNTTIYNDTELDGYVYLAYGDLVKVDRSLVGILPEEYEKVTKFRTNDQNWTKLTYPKTTNIGKDEKKLFSIGIKSMWSPLIYNALYSGTDEYYAVADALKYGIKDYTHQLGNARFSDNNLISRKKEELIEFVKNGNPVIMSDNIYHCVDDYYKKKGGMVYPTSNMYYFVSNTAGLDETMSQFNMYDSLLSQLNSYELEIVSCDVDYIRGSGRYDVPELTYINNEAEYKADIEAYYGKPYSEVTSSGAEAAWNESNHKGLMAYSSVVEKPEDFVYNVTFTATPGHKYAIYLINDKNTDGMYNDEPTTNDENELFYYNEIIASDGQYLINTEIKIEVPEEYIGMFAWRVQIKEYADLGDGNGYTAVDRMVKDGYIPVRADKDTYKVVKVLQICPGIGKNQLDMTGATFKGYMDAVTKRTGYKMVIDIMTTDDYESRFENGKKYVAGDYESENNYLRENGYDMVAIGFYDSFGGQDISDDNGALTCIIDHEAKGKSFLLSHDTIIFTNNVNYNIYVKNGTPYTGATGSKGAVDLTRMLRGLAGMDKYGVTTITARPGANTFDTKVPMKADGTYIYEIQGWSTWHLYRNARKSGDAFSVTASQRDSKVLLPNKNALGYESIKNSTSTMTTTKAMEINEGQVTLYPFKTADSSGQIEVASTHAQYYDLDLDDEEVVVWYTLTGSSGTYNGDNRYDADTNYYIYSKGNITYSGAGHSTMNKASEHKLFLNTLIKAAVAGNYVPTLNILNASKVSDSNEYIIYVDDINTALKVEFVAYDTDLATRSMIESMISRSDYASDEAYEAAIKERIGRFEEGNVYWVDADGNKQRLLHYKYGTSNLLLNGEKNSFYICNPYTDNKNAGMIYTTDDMNNMRDCYNYYLTNGTVKLYFEAADSYGAMGSSTATVMQQDLYDLD